MDCLPLYPCWLVIVAPANVLPGCCEAVGRGLRPMYILHRNLNSYITGVAAPPRSSHSWVYEDGDCGLIAARPKFRESIPD